MKPRLAPTTRIALLVMLVVTLAAIGHFSGVASSLTRERITEIAQAWGLLGVGLYVVVFAVAEIMQLPGAVFVIAAVAAYGPWLGTLVAYAGMNVASLAVFLFGRFVAGKALTEVTHPRVKWLVAEVARAPIRATVIARGVFFVLPGIGYALALSSIRVRDYVIGSAIGLVVPSLLAAILGEWLLRLIG